MVTSWLGWIFRVLVALACGAAVSVATEVVTPEAPVAPDAAAPVEDGPQFALPTTYDRAGRIVVTAYIGDRGPFRFLLDTGANRSVLSERLARELALVPSREYLVHGITGSAVVPVVKVDELRAGELRFPHQYLAILPDAVFGNTDGILGIDVLQKARIDVDFLNDSVAIRGPGRYMAAGYLIVRARLRRGGLLVIPGKVGKIPVSVIVDTGAERTLGNEKLREALAGREAVLQGSVTRVVGATAQVAEGYSFAVPTVDLGGGVFVDRLTVTFGDFHVFKVWSLVERPAMLIGMDALGTLPAFGIDYPRRRVLLKVPTASAPSE